MGKKYNRTRDEDYTRLRGFVELWLAQADLEVVFHPVSSGKGRFVDFNQEYYYDGYKATEYHIVGSITSWLMTKGYIYQFSSVKAELRNWVWSELKRQAGSSDLLTRLTDRPKIVLSKQLASASDKRTGRTTYFIKEKHEAILAHIVAGLISELNDNDFANVFTGRMTKGEEEFLRKWFARRGKHSLADWRREHKHITHPKKKKRGEQGWQREVE